MLNKIIPEIKMSEAEKGRNFEYYLEKVEPYPIISINTISLFCGNINMLRKAKEKYPNKEIIRKDFVILPRQIEESKRAGASHVLLLAEYLTEKQLEKLKKYCNQVGIYPLIEVNSCKKISLPKLILVNSRDLNKGNIERKKAIQVCKKYKKQGHGVIYASGENSSIIAREGIADYVLIGTAFMKGKLRL